MAIVSMSDNAISIRRGERGQAIGCRKFAFATLGGIDKVQVWHGGRGLSFVDGFGSECDLQGPPAAMRALLSVIVAFNPDAKVEYPMQFKAFRRVKVKASAAS